MRFLHPGSAEHKGQPSTGTSATPDGDAADRQAPLESADRACCCLARPVVLVVMPPTAKRPHPVDLLLCGHHYRASADALNAAGAVIYDSRTALAEVGEGTQDPAWVH
jgi:hypothetical protein